MASEISLGLKMQLEISANASTFGYCSSEQFDAVDLAESLDKNSTIKKNNLFYMPKVGFIQQPTYFHQDTMVTDWDVTSGYTGGGVDPNWIQQTDAETQNRCMFMTDATPGNSFSAQSTEVFDVGKPGWLKFGRGLVSANEPINTVIELCTDAEAPSEVDGNVPLKIVLNYNEPPKIQIGVNDGAGGWNYQTAAVSKKYAKSQDIFAHSSRQTWLGWWSFNSYNTIVLILADEYYYIKGNLNTTVYLEGGTGSITFDNPIALASGTIKYSGDNGTAWLMYFPMQFTETASITNGPFQLDYVYANNGQVVLPQSTFPTNTAWSYSIAPYVNPNGVADTTGTVIQYTVNFNSSTYTNTPTIPSIHLYIPPVVRTAFMTEPNIILTDSDIIEVNEHSYEDQSIMQNESMGGGTIGWGITNDLYFKLSNSGAQWVAGLGGTHHNYQYSRALTYYDAMTNKMVPLGPLVTHSTGWTGFQTVNTRQDPYREFSIVCSDKTYPLKRVSCGTQLYLDGWCVYSAMRYQLEKSGIIPDYIDTSSDRGFYTCPFGANPEGCIHPKLPINTLMNPVFAFPMEQKYWANLMDLAGQVYEILWFDVYGVFHRISYADALAQATSMGTFTTACKGDQNDLSTFLMTVHNLQVTVDTYDKRTSVTTVGIDAGTGTMRQKYTKNIDDQLGYGDYTKLSHGFHDGIYVASKRFVDPDYQKQIADKMMEKAIIPNVYVEGVYPFMPNTYIYEKFTIKEGSEFNNYTQFATNQPLDLMCTDINRVYRANYNGTREIFQTMRGRYIPNVS